MRNWMIDTVGTRWGNVAATKWMLAQLMLFMIGLSGQIRIVHFESQSYQIGLSLKPMQCRNKLTTRCPGHSSQGKTWDQVDVPDV